MTAQARRLPQRWLPRVMRRPTPSPPCSPPSSRSGRRPRPPTPSQRGDVLASVGNPSVIARFAPDGTPKGVLADSAARAAVLRPVGRAPHRAGDRALRQRRHPARFGVGIGEPKRRLHRRQGRERLPRGRSVHRGERHRPGPIRKFDLTGHPLSSYDVAATGLTYAAPSTAWTSRRTSARSTTASAAARTSCVTTCARRPSCRGSAARAFPAISCAFVPTAR